MRCRMRASRAASFFSFAFSSSRFCLQEGGVLVVVVGQWYLHAERPPSSLSPSLPHVSEDGMVDKR